MGVGEVRVDGLAGVVVETRDCGTFSGKFRGSKT